MRLGIAAASFKLGDLPTARAAYRRVLALDPDCADAYLGLAVLAASDVNVQQVGAGLWVTVAFRGAGSTRHVSRLV